LGNLSEAEVKSVFDLYRRGNSLPGGDFPKLKNGNIPMARDGNPGTPVDQGTLEYLRSQHIDRLYDLPVGKEQRSDFQERINKLRTEFHNHSVLPEKLREGLFGYYEKVIVQGELADIFYEELKKNNYNGEVAEEKTRRFYKRAWPAFKRGYSVNDLKKGIEDGAKDLNGPEGAVFEVPKPRATGSRAIPKKKSGDVSVPGDEEAGPETGLDLHVNRTPIPAVEPNPFSLKKPKLKRQAELLERSPLLAKQLIVSAGRDPRMFGL